MSHTILKIAFQSKLEEPFGAKLQIISIYCSPLCAGKRLGSMQTWIPSRFNYLGDALLPPSYVLPKGHGQGLIWPGKNCQNTEECWTASFPLSISASSATLPASMDTAHEPLVCSMPSPGPAQLSFDLPKYICSFLLLELICTIYRMALHSY